MKKFISNAITAIIILVTVWMVASFVEVNTKNLSAEPHREYSDWNFFCVMIEISELKQTTQVD